MIVERVTVHYKVGKAEEGLALVLAELERFKFPHAVRVYTPKFGVLNMGVAEYEFEDLNEREQIWANWAAQLEALAFLEKYRELIEPGTTHDIWVLR